MNDLYADIQSLFANSQGLSLLSDDECIKLSDSITGALGALDAEELVELSDIIHKLLSEKE